MLLHETLLVLGASVVGMTIWVGQEQIHLSADVPGIAATSDQGGRLRPASWLASPPPEARVGEDNKNLQPTLY
jgi:hypothetical protein